MTGRTKKTLCLIFMIFASSIYLQAQTGTHTATITVNDVALFAVNTAVAVTFTVDDPAAAGQLPLITSAGGPTYLQYTVVVAAASTKKITAQSDKAMRDGLRLNVWAGNPTGTGGVGTALAGGLEVDNGYTINTPVDIINNITSSATGSGTTQGPAIFYTLTIDESSLDTMVTGAGDAYVITFTLTDG